MIGIIFLNLLGGFMSFVLSGQRCLEKRTSDGVVRRVLVITLFVLSITTFENVKKRNWEEMPSLVRCFPYK